MYRPFKSAATLFVAIGVAGCEKDPLSSNHDVAARTVGHDMTVPHLGGLLGAAKIQMAMTPENSIIIASIWAGYQRLGYAAAHNDTLGSHIAAALAPALNSERVNKLLESLRARAPADTATQAAYESAKFTLYGVRHIAFAYPSRSTSSQRDSVLAKVTAIWPSVTAANFAAMAKKYSDDTTARINGGYLGVFPRAAMNPVVAVVVDTLKGDAISRPIPTALGVEIVGRMAWADARPQYTISYARAAARAADSVTSERIGRAANVSVASGGIDAARDAASNPIKGSRDSTVIATFDRVGRFTVADMIGWVNAMLPAQRAQVLRQLPQQTDGPTTAFVRNLALRGVLLRAADSAKITVPDSLGNAFRERFVKDVVRTWSDLGVLPEQLADSAKTVAEREQLAARRADAALERGLMGRAQLPQVSVPVESALDAKYETLFSSEALRRALEVGARIRSVAADSARVAGGAPRTPPAQTNPTKP